MTQSPSSTVAHDFATGSVARHITALAIPATAAQLVQLLYSVVDRIYLGHLEGTSQMALTGLGLCFPLTAFILAVCNLCAGGAAPLSAMYRGKGELNFAERILGCSCMLLIVSALSLTVLFYLFLEPLLRLCGASNLSLPYAQSYMCFYLPGTLCSMLGTGLSYFMTSQGFAREAMRCTLAGALANIILDPIFIFSLNLGIQGAAIASVLAQILVCVLVLRFCLSNRPLLHLRREYLCLKWTCVKPIVALGLSGFVMQGTNAIVQIACNITLRRFGGDLFIGIMTILSSLRDLIALPMMSLTHSAQPVIAFNFGAGVLTRVQKAVNFITKVSVLYLLIAWGLILLFPAPLIALFGGDGAMLEEGIHALHLYFMGFFFMALHGCGQATFVGLNLPKPAIFFSLMRKVFIVVPLTLTLPYVANLGSDGVFIAEPISNVINGIICYGCMRLTLHHLSVHGRH